VIFFAAIFSHLFASATVWFSCRPGKSLAWQARISSCARTRVRATSEVTIIFQDTILRRRRCDAEAYWRVWALTRLRTAWLDRATIIDDSPSHYSAISLDLVPTGAVARVNNVRGARLAGWQCVALRQLAGLSLCENCKV
jgi:hypothetical protein